MISNVMNAKHDWRPLYPFCTRYLEVDGQQMHYLDEGQGETLLFVHGNPTWSFFWRNFVVSLRENYRCIVVDHVGCGLSEKPQQYDYCLSQHADNLQSVIEQLGLENITLLAHDWGGAIGTLAATRQAERFSRFVLFNTAAFPPPSIPLRIALCRFPLLGTIGMRGLNVFAAAAQSMATSRSGGLDPAVLAGLIAPYDNWANRVAIDRFVADIPMTRQHPTYAVLQQLEQDIQQFDALPCLLAWGMKDWCFTPKCLERFQQLLPRAVTAELSDAGHWVIEDQPQQTIDMVRDFLNHHPLEQTHRSALAP